MIRDVEVAYNIFWDIPSWHKLVRLPKAVDAVSYKKIIDEKYAFYKENSKMLTFCVSDIVSLKILHALLPKEQAVVFELGDEKLDVVEKVTKERPVLLFVETVDYDRMSEILANISSTKATVKLSKKAFKNLDAPFWEAFEQTELLREKVLHFVSPFRELHEYFRRIKQKQPTVYTLWDMMGEAFEKTLYVNQGGRVSLSKSWADAGEFFGKMEDPFEQVKASPLFERLQTLEESVFVKYLECAMCPRYDVCKAYLKFDDQNYACNDFLNAMTTLESYVNKG